MGFWGRRVSVLNGVDLEVGCGEVFGLVGANGAGKSTLFQIVLGLQHPSGGRAWVFGQDSSSVEVHRRIGFLPESARYYGYLTVEQQLQFQGTLLGCERRLLRRRIDELLEMVDLRYAKKEKLGQLSKGMLQRVGIAQALIHDPDLLVLDEPMSGLDSTGRGWLRETLLALRQEGKTIWMTTHAMPDVVVLCDRVAWLTNGRIARTYGRDELLEATRPQRIEVMVEGLSRDAERRIRPLADQLIVLGGRAIVRLGQQAQLHRLLEMVRAAHGIVLSVTVIPSLSLDREPIGSHVEVQASCPHGSLRSA